MRHEFSRKTRREAWERCNEQCEQCSAPLGSGRFEYDHRIPDWMGGSNALINCVVLCLRCHDDKTARDQGHIAKVKRILDKRIKAKTSRNPLPFGKHDRRKKKLDGTVVDRRTGKPL